MPAEVFFAPRNGVGTLTTTQLSADLARAGFKSTAIEDKSDQIWFEFEGYRSRVLVPKEELLTLVTFQLSGDIERESELLDEVEDCLDRHGYIDAEDLVDEA
jgi:hypothetical protein